MPTINWFVILKQLLGALYTLWRPRSKLHIRRFQPSLFQSLKAVQHFQSILDSVSTYPTYITRMGDNSESPMTSVGGHLLMRISLHLPAHAIRFLGSLKIGLVLSSFWHLTQLKPAFGSSLFRLQTRRRSTLVNRLDHVGTYEYYNVCEIMNDISFFAQ